MYKKITQITVILYLFLVACKKENSTEPTVYQVPSEVDIYIDTFIEEGKKRGKIIKKENLVLEFKTQQLSEKCGQCTQVINSNSQKNVLIVKNATCWTSAVNQNKEALIFHELGHCWLGRIKHRDDLLPNGATASIMTTQLNGQYEPCMYVIGDDLSCNKTSRREYYLDELFNEKTPVPGWGK